nr:PREDICTED: fatty acyl-CoA reductase 1-like isoform X1 [Bemisia tabaci]
MRRDSSPSDMTKSQEGRRKGKSTHSGAQSTGEGQKSEMEPTIPEFFRDKHVLITGGTGFMGKVLIEKLVRSCGSVAKIYLLVRQKKDKNAADRIKELTEQPVFERVLREQPGAFERIVAPVNGDVTQEKLGLSAEDEDLLIKNVSIIFHVAASVRFDDPIPDAVRMNTRGTREVINLAKKMPNLKALLHVSTTYCNCMRMEVEEKVYPMQVDWREAIDVAEKVDRATLNILSEKYLGKFPNTYTFTKNLAEQIMLEHKDELPVIVFRPSIVISTLKEPIPGWIDNFNGPTGLLVGVGKGVIRTTMADKSAVPDYMPVDVSVKAMIVAAWLTGVRKDKEKGILPVYNSSSRYLSISTRELNDMGMEALMKYPFPKVLWYPSCVTTKNHTCFYVNHILQHLIPALLLDNLLKLTNRQPLLVKLYRRYYLAMMALCYFTTKSWTFYNNKFLALCDEIHSTDREDFDFNFQNVAPKTFFENIIQGGYIYLLKNDLSLLPEARINIRRMYLLDRVVKGICTGVFLWYLCSKSSLHMFQNVLYRILSVLVPLSF